MSGLLRFEIRRVPLSAIYPFMIAETAGASMLLDFRGRRSNALMSSLMWIAHR